MTRIAFVLVGLCLVVTSVSAADPSSGSAAYPPDHPRRIDRNEPTPLRITLILCQFFLTSSLAPKWLRAVEPSPPPAGEGRLKSFSVNKNRKGGPGRDHWSKSMSALVASGGMRVGQVVGSTDGRGERPQDRPLHPNDVWATLYRHLGVDWTEAYPNNAGRPIPILPHGEPIAEIA